MNSSKKLKLNRFWIILVLVGLLGLAFSVGVTTRQVEAAVPPLPTNVMDTQFDKTACLFGAIVSAWNYSQPGPLRYSYSSDALAVYYYKVYGAADWAKDGTTAHRAQELGRDFGFTPTYGQMPSLNTLQYLAAAQKYPVVFLAGQPEHAVTVITYLADTGEIVFGDPINGSINLMKLDVFWSKLDGPKWFVYYTYTGLAWYTPQN